MTDVTCYTSYYRNGSIHFKIWSKNGLVHNDHDMPAYIYYEKGGVVYMEWYRAGLAHRDKFPAKINYDGDGRITKTSWYTSGIEMKQPYEMDHMTVSLDQSIVRITNMTLYDVWHDGYTDNDKPNFSPVLSK